MISARGWGSSGHSFRGYKVHSKATWPIQTHTHTLKEKKDAFTTKTISKVFVGETVDVRVGR